jgi:hypothetical protein
LSLILRNVREFRCGARISQRLEPIFEWFGQPGLVAIEADVFPADWCDVGGQRVGQPFAPGREAQRRAAVINGVPEYDGGDRKIEAGGPLALVFEGAVPDLAVTMEKQGAGQRVSGLAFIEPTVGTV